MQRVKRSTAIAVLPATPAGGTPGYFAAPDPAGGVPATVPGYEWYNAVQEEIVALITAAGLTLSSANNAQMAEAVQRLIDAQSGNYALDTGVANAYVVALNPAIAAYSDGMTVRVKIVNANTGASTLNAGGGAVPLVNDVAGALVAGDLPAGGIVTATYIASENKFRITSLVQSQNDARYAALGQFQNSLSLPGYQKLPGGLIMQWGRVDFTGGATATFTHPIAFPVENLAAWCVIERNTSSTDSAAIWDVAGRLLTSTKVQNSLGGAQALGCLVFVIGK